VDLLAPIRAFDRLQRRIPPLAIAVAVLRSVSDQGAGNTAALIAWWGFFSLFPLYLLFVTILGFFLQGHPAAQHAVLNSALRQFPIIGPDLRRLDGNSVALGVGLAGTLWSGLEVTIAVQTAFNLIYAVPHRKQGNFFVRRLRGIKLLLAAGGLQIFSTAISGAVSAGLGRGIFPVAGVLVSLALNLALFTIAFRFLTPGAVPSRELRPGILIATVGWELLQALGGFYVRHAIQGDSETYGTFAEVIGFLVWLYLGAEILVYAAEINVVLTRHLWPRSLMDPPEPADRRARAMLAKMEERDDRETVEVSFHPPTAHDDGELGHVAYAVAPQPAPGEVASAALEGFAGVDIHTMTFAQMLEVLGEGLDALELPKATRDRARRWLKEAAEVSEGAPQGEDSRPFDPPEREVVAALAAAAERALGLARPQQAAAAERPLGLASPQQAIPPADGLPAQPADAGR
jgi:membrane protein